MISNLRYGNNQDQLSVFLYTLRDYVYYINTIYGGSIITREGPFVPNAYVQSVAPDKREKLFNHFSKDTTNFQSAVNANGIFVGQSKWTMPKSLAKEIPSPNYLGVFASVEDLEAANPAASNISKLAGIKSVLGTGVTGDYKVVNNTWTLSGKLGEFATILSDIDLEYFVQVIQDLGLVYVGLSQVAAPVVKTGYKANGVADTRAYIKKDIKPGTVSVSVTGTQTKTYTDTVKAGVLADSAGVVVGFIDYLKGRVNFLANALVFGDSWELTASYYELAF